MMNLLEFYSELFRRGSVSSLAIYFWDQKMNKQHVFFFVCIYSSLKLKMLAIKAAIPKLSKGLQKLLSVISWCSSFEVHVLCNWVSFHGAGEYRSSWTVSYQLFVFKLPFISFNGVWQTQNFWKLSLSNKNT